VKGKQKDEIRRNKRDEHMAKSPQTELGWGVKEYSRTFATYSPEGKTTLTMSLSRLCFAGFPILISTCKRRLGFHLTLSLQGTLPLTEIFFPF